MIEIIPNYHPIFVHFTLGLLGSSVGLFVLTRVISNQDLKHQLLTVALWNLWLGAMVTIITIGAGWYAFNTVEHDDPSHLVMLNHRNLALSTFIIVMVLAVWSWRKFRHAEQISIPFLAAAILAAGLLVATAWHGAELVFRHGLGVISLPDKDAHHHGSNGHSHDDGDDHHHDSDDADHQHDEDIADHQHDEDEDAEDHHHDDGDDHSH